MKAHQLSIVDGNAPGQRNRFGNFAANVIAGGSVSDADCDAPVQAGGHYVVRRAFTVTWVELRDRREGVGVWSVGFFFTIGKAQRVADELNRARALGILDVFR